MNEDITLKFLLKKYIKYNNRIFIELSSKKEHEKLITYDFMDFLYNTKYIVIFDLIIKYYKKLYFFCNIKNITDDYYDNNTKNIKFINIKHFFNWNNPTYFYNMINKIKLISKRVPFIFISFYYNSSNSYDFYHYIDRFINMHKKLFMILKKCNFNNIIKIKCEFLFPLENNVIEKRKLELDDKISFDVYINDIITPCVSLYKIYNELLYYFIYYII